MFENNISESKIFIFAQKSQKLKEPIIIESQ